MKKRISLSLVAAMLFALVAMFAVAPASAADASTPLAVTHVSATENLDNDGGNAIDWSKVWDPSNTTRLGAHFNEDVEMIGKLTTPSRITKITICNQYYSTRSNNIVISFSTDGETWTNAITLLGIPNVRKTANTYTLPVVDDTEYSYVKLSKPVALNDGGSGYIYFDLRWVAFYCDTESVPAPAKVNHISAMDGAPATIANIWNPDNATSCNFNTSGKNGELLRGSFEAPTVLTDIYAKLLYPSYNARMNHMIFEGSNDGETWKEVARTNGTLANAGNIVHLRVTDTTPYKYIRMVKNQTYGWWSCVSLTFLGESVPDAGEAYAQSKNYTYEGNEVYAVRFLSTISADALGYQSVGFDIKATYEGGEQSFSKDVTTVYTSVMANGEPVTATQLGGDYIFAVTVDRISIAKYGEITFEVRPYVVTDKGVKLYSDTCIFVYNDGVVVE